LLEILTLKGCYDFQKKNVNIISSPFLTDPCGMQFFTEHELNQHDSRIHLTEASDELKVICDTCGLHVPKRVMALHKHSHKIEDGGPQVICHKSKVSKNQAIAIFLFYCISRLVKHVAKYWPALEGCANTFDGCTKK
jgi:hypothetical protein